MKKIFLFLLLFTASFCNAQIISFIYHGDSLYAKNPLTGDSTVIVSGSAAVAVISKLSYIISMNASPLIAGGAIGTPTSGNLANCTFPTLNQNTTGSAAKLTTARNINNTLFDGSADITIAQTTAATSAPTGTMTVDMSLPYQTSKTITPTGACTFNASGGTTGYYKTFVFTTSGTSAFVMTFNTNFKSAGTLSTGTVSGKIFAVTFYCTNGTQWIETARTIAQ